jgi:hypothetical protein
MGCVFRQIRTECGKEGKGEKKWRTVTDGHFNLHFLRGRKWRRIVWTEKQQRRESETIRINTLKLVTFQVLTAASMRFRVLWDVAPCSYVEVHRRFRGAYCLYHQGDDDRPDD